MKNQTTIRLCTLMLFLGGIFFTSSSQAQNCPSNKVWACRYDECGVQECKCINPNQVPNWTATIPPCNTGWNPHCCHGGTWRTGQNESNQELKYELQVSPNPASGTAIISFSLENAQNVTIGIYDMSGRLVSTLADNIYEEGINEITWSPGNINNGVYFIQILSQGTREQVKLIVAK